MNKEFTTSTVRVSSLFTGRLDSNRSRICARQISFTRDILHARALLDICAIMTIYFL